MSIKKTSILALSVLLSYESFAAPTVLATTPRLGASSSVASTGRGKATTSVSIGGGLNKLTSNRGQSSFTPNSAPTDKQNELIENFQKEIQNVRDAVAEELQAQNDKIRELESVIEEKDEKIAELEESIDEKIESKGFVTAESVTSEISTAKQEAVRQATNAAVKEVNSMGFAKTATVQSDILSAKNAAIAQAKTEAVAEVNGMGFAKTATINSDILNAKNAAIEQATTAALAEVESKGFATNVSVQNLKAEITTERNEALKSYATSAQLAEDIDAAKSEITTARNTALQSYATSADVSSAVTAAKSEITNARNAALKSYATSAQLAEDIDAAKSEITNARNTALQSYAKSADVSSAVTAAKTEAIAAANTAIAAESATRSAIVEKLATKEELQNLEVGVDEERLAGIIDGKLQEQGFATATDLNELDGRVAQNTQDIADALSDITEEKGRIENLNTRLDRDFVTSTALTTYKGEVADALQDFATTESVNNRFNEISGTIAGNLLADTAFKAGVLEGLSTELTGLPARVTQLDEVVKGLATQDDLNRVDGKFASYVEIDDVNNRFTELDGKFVKPATLDNYATTNALTAYLKKEDQANFGNLLSANGTFSALNTKVNGLGTTVGTLQSSVDNMPATVIGKMRDDEKSDNYIGNWTKDGKPLVVTRGNASTLTDDKGQPLFMTQATLGTGVASLFGVKEQSDLTKLNTTVTDLSKNAITTGNMADKGVVTTSTLSGNLGTLASNGQLPSSIVTTANMVDKGVVTTGNFADKLTANNVVTTNNLAAKLYTELTATKNKDGTCQQPQGDKAALIDLFIEGNVGECSTSGGN